MRVEKPNRVSHSYTQHLNAPPSTVFELLCPVRETEWVNDWRPKLVLSDSMGRTISFSYQRKRCRGGSISIHGLRMDSFCSADTLGWIQIGARGL